MNVPLPHPRRSPFGLRRFGFWEHRFPDGQGYADIYGHVGPQSNRVAAEAMKAVLTGNRTQPPRNLSR